jgi:hypothetical protein
MMVLLTLLPPVLAGELRIHQGEPTDAFPTAVSVGVSDGGAHVSLCTGVVVSGDVVVTAAHCLADLDIFAGVGLDAEVRLPGAGDDGGDQRLLILEALPHPEWDPEGEDLGYPRDVAVLHLAGPVAVAPAALAQPPRDGWLGMSLSLVGFGATGNDGGGSGERQLLVLPVVEESASFLRLYAEGSGNLCAGDSGGPAYLVVDGEPELVGLNVFTWQPDGGSGCEGGGTGTLLSEPVWDWVEAEVEGREWTPGCGGCAAGGRGSGGGVWLVAILGLLGRRRRAM